ncbi:MAG: glycosyltransferase [Lachnospiraceae bacterium]|nr:glycosyltransferase [Lachnospiraceae bacterium]
MEKTVKISIITVCYNAEKVIEETIRSVLAQTYQNIEYIIVDGVSKDRTMDIIRIYEADKRIRVISEPDKGIYDAMNKGSMAAAGDYVQFLNAGDTLADERVVEKVADQIRQKPADIVYGDIIYQYPDGTTSIRVYGQFCSSLIYYLLGDCINHQAIFAKRECFNKYKFDLSYKICADREWMIRLKKDGYTFSALNMLICAYSLDENSASIRDGDIYYEEADRCIREHLRIGHWLYSLIDRVRHGNLSARVLHGMYKIVFLRKRS